MSDSKKYDQGKLRWDLLPLNLIEKVVEIYTFGAEKYGANTWQNLEDGYNRYKAAMFRHLMEFEKGNVIDDESGREHLAHMVWNSIAMLYMSDNTDNILSHTEMYIKMIEDIEASLKSVKENLKPSNQHERKVLHQVS